MLCFFLWGFQETNLCLFGAQASMHISKTKRCLQLPGCRNTFHKIYFPIWLRGKGSHMGVEPKIVVITPTQKWMVKISWFQPYFSMEDLGGKENPLFLVQHPYGILIMLPQNFTTICPFPIPLSGPRGPRCTLHLFVWPTDLSVNSGRVRSWLINLGCADPRRVEMAVGVFQGSLGVGTGLIFSSMQLHVVGIFVCAL